jgi:hypothetical protein
MTCNCFSCCVALEQGRCYVVCVKREGRCYVSTYVVTIDATGRFQQTHLALHYRRVLKYTMITNRISEGSFQAKIDSPTRKVLSRYFDEALTKDDLLNKPGQL